MKKRLAALLLALSLLLGLCGCSALFKKEYLSVSQYTEGEYDDYEGYMCDVSTYAGLKRAINQMVSKHSAEERIRFADYDGNPQTDLAQSCWEIKSETALASYAVDYMSYDLNRIVNYYEAVIYIAYKHSEEDVASIVNVSGLDGLKQQLDPLLADMANYAVFHIPDAELQESDVIDAVKSVYMQDPASCVVMPTVQVQLHPKTGIFRIAEIELYYGRTQTVLAELRQELQSKLTELSGMLQKEDKSMFLLDAYNLLASNCAYDSDGSLRSEQKLEAYLGSTAYGALVQNLADSQGIALAFSALCRQAGIDCIVVEGSFEDAPHFWNIVELDGEYYHIDVSADSTWGMGNSFMVRDEQLQNRYWWDIEKYPACQPAQQQ